MISGIFLQSYSLYGGSISTFFYQLQSLGFFDYILPFLIIFGIVFGVMNRIKLFGENKPTYAIISIAVALLALQFGFVSQFFAAIFPELGVWLSVLLVAFIILGIVNVNRKWNKAVMALSGVVVLVIVLVKSFGQTWYNFGYWLPYNWNWGVTIAIIAVLIGLGIMIGGPSKERSKKSNMFKNLLESMPYEND